jgi:hypothetical protein
MSHLQDLVMDASLCAAASSASATPQENDVAIATTRQSRIIEVIVCLPPYGIRDDLGRMRPMERLPLNCETFVVG